MPKVVEADFPVPTIAVEPAGDVSGEIPFDLLDVTPRNKVQKKFRIQETPDKRGSLLDLEEGPSQELIEANAMTLNSRTYVYEPDKSLRRLTLDVLPAEKNYQVS